MDGRGGAAAGGRGRVMEPAVLDISPLVVWVIALTQLLTFGLAVWNLMSTGGRANALKLEKLAVQINVHDQRLSAIDLVLRAMPTKDNMHDLEIKMERLNGELSTMSTAMRGNTAIMERLETIVARHDAHLMDGGRR